MFTFHWGHGLTGRYVNKQLAPVSSIRLFFWSFAEIKAAMHFWTGSAVCLLLRPASMTHVNKLLAGKFLSFKGNVPKKIDKNTSNVLCSQKLSNPALVSFRLTRDFRRSLKSSTL